jgi:hypothetical protein
MYQLPPPKYNNDTSCVIITDSNTMVTTSMENLQRIMNKKYLSIAKSKESEIKSVNSWYLSKMKVINDQRDEKLNNLSSKYNILVDVTNEKLLGKLTKAIQSISIDYTTSLWSRFYEYVTSIIY